MEEAHIGEGGSIGGGGIGVGSMEEAHIGGGGSVGGCSIRAESASDVCKQNGFLWRSAPLYDAV